MCYYYRKLSAVEFCDNLTPVNKMNNPALYSCFIEDQL